jgi:hypothetical protein
MYRGMFEHLATCGESAEWLSAFHRPIHFPMLMRTGLVQTMNQLTMLVFKRKRSGQMRLTQRQFM